MWPSVFQVTMVMRSFCGSGATRVTPRISFVTVTCALCDFVGLFCAYDISCKSAHRGRTISALWLFLRALPMSSPGYFFPYTDRGSEEREILPRLDWSRFFLCCFLKIFIIISCTLAWIVSITEETVFPSKLKTTRTTDTSVRKEKEEVTCCWGAGWMDGETKMPNLNLTTIRFSFPTHS